MREKIAQDTSARTLPPLRMSVLVRQNVEIQRDAHGSTIGMMIDDYLRGLDADILELTIHLGE